MMKYVAWTLVGAIIGSIGFALFIRTPRTEPRSATTLIGGIEFNLEVVDTDKTRTQGLSGREALQQNAGMLFVFDEPDTYGFWMKDMHFPLDIIWLDEQFKIVHVEQNVSPETYPTVFTPEGKARYVLEVNAGVASELHIKSGTHLEVVFQ